MRWTSAALVTLLACRGKPPARGPEIDIIVRSPGMSAPDMESAITNPIEDSASSHVTRIARIHSRTSDQLAVIHVELEPGADLDLGVTDVQRSLVAVARQLPPRTDPPVVSKAGGKVIARFVMLSDTMPLVELHGVIEMMLVRQIEQTAGVGRVEMCGDRQPQLEIDVDPARLASVGLDIPAVGKAIRDLGGGVKMTARSLSDSVIATRGALEIRLNDVANVRDGQREPTCVAYYRGRQTVEAVVRAQPGADVEAVRAEIDKIIADARRRLPSGLELVTPPSITPLAISVTPGAKNIESRLPRELVEVLEVRPDGSWLAIPTAEGLARLDELRARPIDGVTGIGVPDATLELVGPDHDALRVAARQASALVHAFGRLGLDGVPARRFEIDRAAAADVGVPVNAISDSLAALDGLQIGRGPDGPVVIRVLGDLSTMDALSVIGAGGARMPLASLVKVTMDVQTEIFHDNRQPMVGLRVRASDVPSLEALQLPPGVRSKVVPD